MSVIFGLADRIRVDHGRFVDTAFIFNNVTFKKNTWFSTPNVSFGVQIKADWVSGVNTDLVTSTPSQTEGIPIVVLHFSSNEKGPLRFSCAMAENKYVFMLNDKILFESKYSLPIPIHYSGMSVAVSKWEHHA